MANVCYTCVTKNYDTLQEVLWKDVKNWRFLCFTTENIRSKTWEIIKLKREADPIRQARKIKITSTFDCNYSIYVDGNIRVVGDLNSFVRPLKKYDIALMNHPHRSNLEEEVDAIIKMIRNNTKLITTIIKAQLISI